MLKLNFTAAFGLASLSGCLWFLAVTPFDLSLLAWIAAVPLGLLLTAWPAYKLDLLRKDDVLNVFVGSGAGRYVRLAGSKKECLLENIP